MTPDMFNDYEGMRNRGVILFFNGPMSQTVVEGMAGIMRDKMRAEDAAMGVTQRVFAILVEQMQNIVRYSAERVNDAREGTLAHGQVVVGRETDGRFFVACGNRIRSADGEGLVRRIEHIRSLSDQDLKAHYRQTRRAAPTQGALGAGLGLIEMARQAARPLDFRITPLDTATAFFTMKVVA
jgi:hypothetical protein